MRMYSKYEPYQCYCKICLKTVFLCACILAKNRISSTAGSTMVTMLLVCRGEGGAKPSFAMKNEALSEADCDWIIVCPCGLDLETTARELTAVTSHSWW